MDTGTLDNIHIVLVATSHPGNIGAAARAMKTMGLRSLQLVRPGSFPSAEVTARAAGADDILAKAGLHDDLGSALAGCNFVAGTTARSRTLPWPVVDPERAALELVKLSTTGSRVALLFGTERSGLSNEELEYCNTVVAIPTAPDYSSLNLAAAVQVLCYEIRKAAIKSSQMDTGLPELEMVSVEQMSLLYEHLQKCLAELDYLDPGNPRLLMRRLKRLFNRAQLDQNEYNILRGILSAAEDAASAAKRARK